MGRKLKILNIELMVRKSKIGINEIGFWFTFLGCRLFLSIKKGKEKKGFKIPGEAMQGLENLITYPKKGQKILKKNK